MILQRIAYRFGYVPCEDYELCDRKRTEAEATLFFLAWASDAEVHAEWGRRDSTEDGTIADKLRMIARDKGVNIVPSTNLGSIGRMFNWRMSQPSPLMTLFQSKVDP